MELNKRDQMYMEEKNQRMRIETALQVKKDKNVKNSVFSCTLSFIAFVVVKIGDFSQDERQRRQTQESWRCWKVRLLFFRLKYYLYDICMQKLGQKDFIRK